MNERTDLDLKVRGDRLEERLDRGRVEVNCFIKGLAQNREDLPILRDEVFGRGLPIVSKSSRK